MDQKLQLSDVITQSQIVGYCVNNCSNWDRISIRGCIHKTHPYLTLTGELWDVFINNCEKIDRIITAPHLTFCDLTERAWNGAEIDGDSTPKWFLYGDTLELTLIARFMGPTWDPPGADRTQVGPMMATWTLLSGNVWKWRLIVQPRCQQKLVFSVAFVPGLTLKQKCHYLGENFIPGCTKNGKEVIKNLQYEKFQFQCS